MATLVRDHQTLHYDVHGSGDRTVLLAHNLLCDRQVFAGLIPSLSSDYRIVNVDQRGHGDSMATSRGFGVSDLVEDLLAILDAVEAPRATLVGISLGSTVAMELALAHPERVEGLVLFGASALDATRWDAFQNTLLAAVVRCLGWRGFVISQLLPILFGESFRRDEPETLARWTATLRARSRRSTWRAVRCWATRPRQLERLGAIEARTLVVSGGEDAAHPAPLGEQIAAAIPGAEYACVPNAGHTMTLERPARTGELLERFLAGDPTCRSSSK